MVEETDRLPSTFRVLSEERTARTAIRTGSAHSGHRARAAAVSRPVSVITWAAGRIASRARLFHRIDLRLEPAFAGEIRRALLLRHEGEKRLRAFGPHRVHRRPDRLHQLLGLAVRLVEHRIHLHALVRRNPDVVVHAHASRHTLRLLGHDAIGRESEDSTDKYCSEQEHERLLFGALHGFLLSVSE